MRTLAIPSVALLGLLCLSGCLPTPEPEGPGSSSPAPTPSPETSSEVPLAEIVLPDCEGLYTPEQVTSLIGEGMEGIGDATIPETDGGFGTSISELQTVLRSDDAIHCTWVLPATERGLSVSLMVVTDAELAQINSVLDALGIGSTSIGGGAEIRSFAVEGEYPFTEAHGLAGTLWISARDGFGENAPALVQAALDSVVALNPGRF